MLHKLGGIKEIYIKQIILKVIILLVTLFVTTTKLSLKFKEIFHGMDYNILKENRTTVLYCWEELTKSDIYNILTVFGELKSSV